MRISDCKNRTEAKHGLRSDFGDRAKVMSKKSSDEFPFRFSIDLKSALRNLKSAIVTGAMLFALCSSAEAQQPKKIPRIGFLGNSTAALEANLIGPFREGLHDLGYVEGKNIVIEWRWAEGKYERFPALIAELIASKVDLIVTAGTPATIALKKATTTLPLVMIAVGDPVGTGLIASLAHPGGTLPG